MKNRRGNTTEYILILTLLLGVGLVIFWNTLGPAIAEKIQSMGLDFEWMGKKSSKTKGKDQASATGIFSNGSGGSPDDSGEISYDATVILSTGPATSK